MNNQSPDPEPTPLRTSSFEPSPSPPADWSEYTPPPETVPSLFYGDQTVPSVLSLWRDAETGEIVQLSPSGDDEVIDNAPILQRVDGGHFTISSNVPPAYIQLDYFIGPELPSDGAPATNVPCPGPDCTVTSDETSLTIGWDAPTGATWIVLYVEYAALSQRDIDQGLAGYSVSWVSRFPNQ